MKRWLVKNTIRVNGKVDFQESFIIEAYTYQEARLIAKERSANVDRWYQDFGNKHA